MQFAINKDVIDGLKRGLLIGAVGVAVLLPPIHFARSHWAHTHAAHMQSPANDGAQSGLAANNSAAHTPRFADFGDVEPPADVRRIADWSADSGDSRGMDFVVLDKRQAHVYVFSADGRLRDHTPVLLGAAAGDDSVDGIGQKALHDVRPEERTTPAGRFVGQSGRNATGEDVFWVDYKAAVSMHRLRQVEASERRAERLATPTADDNRISYGCINMPPAFYDSVMVPTFKGRRGVVYVLPETRPLEKDFPTAYDVAARYRDALRQAALGSTRG